MSANTSVPAFANAATPPSQPDEDRQMTNIPRTIVGMPTFALIVASIGLLADQISKYVVVEKILRPEGVSETPFLTARVIDLLPFLSIRLSWNAGISFSMFNSGETLTWALLLAVQIGVTIVLLFWLRHMDRFWLQLGSGLIIGGALGNTVDRALYGAVVDFLDFYWGTWHFPTFNVADSCISVGAALWLLDAAFARPQHTPATPPQDPVP